MTGALIMMPSAYFASYFESHTLLSGRASAF